MSSSRFFRKEDIAGKTVIESSGRELGKVKDVLVSLEGNVALVVEKQDGVDIRIPLARIMGISNVVIAKSEMAIPSASAGESAVASGLARACKYCGTSVPSGTAWCPNCGRAQS